MELEAVYDAKDDIPEEVLSLDLYAEGKDGKWEFTGVKGLKTEEDIRRIQAGVVKERDAHKATKAKLKGWTDLGIDSPDLVQSKLDRFDELETAADGNLDDEKIEAIVEKRIVSKVAPLERKLKTAQEENTGLTDQINTFTQQEVTRTKGDSVRKAALKAKIRSTAIDDALLLGQNQLVINEEGEVTTKEGLTTAQWLNDLQEARPHWWGESVGGGAGGAKGGGGTGNNPFSHANWNVTEQGRAYKENPEKAKQLAQAAGTKLGGLRPAAKK